MVLETPKGGAWPKPKPPSSTNVAASRGTQASAAHARGKAASGATSTRSTAANKAAAKPGAAPTAGAASKPATGAAAKAGSPGGQRGGLGSRDYAGEAHKLYLKYAKGGDLIKRQMLQMMKALVKEGKFKCASEDKLKKFVDSEFAKTDVNLDGKLSFEEFLEFFGRWLDASVQELVEHHEQQACKVEVMFMRYDTNHDFNITADELRLLVEEMHPPGLPKPPEEEIQQCVSELMRLDANANGGISFEEFALGYNTMVDRIHAMHKEQRRKVMEQSPGFRSMIKDEGEDEALQKATAAKYDGVGKYGVWVASEHDLPEAQQRARDAGKIALFLDAPPGELDMPTSRYAARVGGRGRVVNLQQMVMHVAERKTTEEEAVASLRDTVLDCMAGGQELILRLGHTAPDFMLKWHRKDLPLDWLTPEATQPGPLPPVLHGMVQKPHDAAKFRIEEGYALVITSCFNMLDYHDFLRAKLPLQYMQPVQVMPTLADVADVLRDGLKTGDDDDALAEIDRLADLL